MSKAGYYSDKGDSYFFGILWRNTVATIFAFQVYPYNVKAFKGVHCQESPRIGKLIELILTAKIEAVATFKTRKKSLI